MTGPRVRRNEWDALTPPALGSGEPLPSVTVVMPAWDAGELLPSVLAGLAAQTQPAHLLEVIVVDDGPVPLALPEVRPENTRIVAVERGWGRANACHIGALAADGEVLHWYDADMLAERHEVEAHARWHGLIDHAVVLGDRTFVDPAPALALGPAALRDAVAEGRVGELFPVEGRQAHTWVEEMYERTDLLRLAGWYAVRAHVGMTGSVRRDLYLESGGMDPRLRLGEDTALGVRLGEVGAVFVPDREARSWHLGLSNVMRRHERVNLYNEPYLADGSPVLRGRRRAGRIYREPYLDVVLDLRELAEGEGESALSTVDAVLDSTLDDVRVLLAGDWGRLDDERAAVLEDPRFDLRLVHDSYRHDPRVRLLPEPPSSADPEEGTAPFRLTLPGIAWAPTATTLERLVLHLEHTHDGLRIVDLPDGTVARLERRAAFARARRVAEPGEPLDDVVAQVAGVERVVGKAVGFGPALQVRPPHYPRTGGPPLESAEAWERVAKQMGQRVRQRRRTAEGR